MDPFDVIQAETSREREIDRCRRQVWAELRAGRDVVLDVVSSREAIAAVHEVGQRQGLDGLRVGATIVESLAEITASVVERAV